MSIGNSVVLSMRLGLGFWRVKGISVVTTAMTSESLISGYETYVTSVDFTAVSTLDAPAATPAILSFVGMSSLACGTAVSAIGGSVAGTITKGC